MTTYSKWEAKLTRIGVWYASRPKNPEEQYLSKLVRRQGNLPQVGCNKHLTDRELQANIVITVARQGISRSTKDFIQKEKVVYPREKSRAGANHSQHEYQRRLGI